MIKYEVFQEHHYNHFMINSWSGTNLPLNKTSYHSVLCMHKSTGLRCSYTTMASSSQNITVFHWFPVAHKSANHYFLLRWSHFPHTAQQKWLSVVPCHNVLDQSSKAEPSVPRYPCEWPVLKKSFPAWQGGGVCTVFVVEPESWIQNEPTLSHLLPGH